MYNEEHVVYKSDDSIFLLSGVLPKHSRFICTAYWPNLRTHCGPWVKKFAHSCYMAALKNVMIDSV